MPDPARGHVTSLVARSPTDPDTGFAWLTRNKPEYEGFVELTLPEVGTITTVA